MIENISIEELPNISLDQLTINNILSIIRSTTLMEVHRNYMFVDRIKGYSLSQLCNNSTELNSVVSMILGKLSVEVLLENMKIFEQGIALNTTQNVIDTAIHPHYELDFRSRHIRIPLSGVSYINEMKLVIGKAYVMDIANRQNFRADTDAIHLIFNYLSRTEEKYPWELWYGHEYII